SGLPHPTSTTTALLAVAAGRTCRICTTATPPPAVQCPGLSPPFLLFEHLEAPGPDDSSSISSCPCDLVEPGGRPFAFRFVLQYFELGTLGQMTGGLAAAYIWEQWDIQILVVLSFTLQVILLLSAGTRRREGSPLLRTVIWLAYLLADYTAIYALGHMSISSRSGEHQIMPFWAPFLLLHLGGPDTITAYAFQDNQLWLRHLLTLVVQVIGAAYVLFQFVTVGKNPSTLLAAAALMFISGCLKYGERTWALKCGHMDSITSHQHSYVYNRA
ncbi:hypothetical protein EJB05_00463, partial [Eragrostis curvula]